MANRTLKTTRRKKGTGSIEKKANGTYLGKLRVSGYETFYYTGSSEREVQKKLNEFRILTQRKEIIPRRQTVNAYIEVWLKTIKKPSMKPASLLSGKLNDAPSGRLFRADFRTLQMCQSL